MQFFIPEKTEFVIEKLLENGYKAYIVGGSVRDILLGNAPSDFDITTNAFPEQVKKIFPKTADTGIKHGTVTVIIDKTPLEVTTFRTESEYGDSRHPEKVSFVGDLKSDLSRRDFTVNAMAYNKAEGLIDCFGGRKDLENKILRAVGNPKIRFEEDALRILRLFRFASTLCFEIEEETKKAALVSAQNLKKISAERIFAELKKGSEGENVSAFLPLLETGALEFLCLKGGNVDKILYLPKGNLRFFAFLNQLSFNFEKTLELFKCSNAFKDYCIMLKRFLSFKKPETKAEIKRFLNLNDKIFEDYLLLIKADKKTIQAYKEIKESGEAYKLNQLKIGGENIVSLGASGKRIGEIMEKLLEAVIEKPELNKKEKLLSLAKTMI